MKNTILASVLVGLMGAGSAFALELNHKYVGVAAGIARGPVASSALTDTVSRQTASVLVGNQFTPAVSAEIALGPVRRNAGTTGALASVTGRYTLAVPQTALRVSGALGLATTFVEDAADERFQVSPVIGVGAEYALNRTWSVRADYRVMPHFGASSSRVATTTVGLSSKF